MSKSEKNCQFSFLKINVYKIHSIVNNIFLLNFIYCKRLTELSTKVCILLYDKQPPPIFR